MENQTVTTGAGEQTPSIPYYFSWINNTNEGSTERQTLINLDFFRYMRENFGMQIRIYAWDAGNFDGASQGYGDLRSEKFRAQYPQGYRNVVEKAASLGIRFGLWGSPDGFGDTPEEERERVDFFVHLCRDYHFAAFKLDGVCGRLRPEKAKTYAAMIEECRKYAPDLILLNHRLDFYEAQKYITTFLWNGEETYTDVFAHNRVTAPHNRAYTFSRGNVTDENGNLIRLAEDHGVCLSSAMDYFEDDLVYQAFGRCLIAAPEIYGNPWLLKDAELPRLARIYRLHAAYAPILVNGMLLPPALGPNAVSRGDGTTRLICTGNDAWEPKTVRLPLDEIGLAAKGQVRVTLLHPYVQELGTFSADARVPVTLPPFRAALIRATADLTDQLTLNEDVFAETDLAARTEKAPVFLGELTEKITAPANGEALYEAAMFSICNDSLEARCRERAGETRIPEVQAAREAFFAQKTYRLRGCEAAAMFDGNDETFFDGQSRNYCDRPLRIDGGCLRVDFGEALEADCVEIECFAADAPTREVPAQQITAYAEYAENFANWKQSGECEVTDCGKTLQQVVKFTVHTLYTLEGKRLRVSYPVNGKLRYLRISEPMDRIYSIRLLRNGNPLPLKAPFANNLQAHYAKKPTKLVKTAAFTVPEHREGAYLALGINGDHGSEGVYCTAALDGALCGFEGRAPSYKADVWEHRVCDEPLNNTFYFRLPPDCAGKTVRLYASFSTEAGENCVCRAYLCDRHD